MPHFVNFENRGSAFNLFRIRFSPENGAENMIRLWADTWNAPVKKAIPRKKTSLMYNNNAHGFVLTGNLFSPENMLKEKR